MNDTATRLLFLSVELTCLSSTPALALNEPSHELINERAGFFVEFDNFLKRRLGLLRGSEESLFGQTPFEWLRIGGAREDDRVNFFQHFRDPSSSTFATRGNPGRRRA